MGLPTGEVQQHELLEWALGQAKFLTPTQAHVLLYLCINAWHTDTNPEGSPAGQVLRGRTALRKIQLFTGLSERTIRDALNALQDEGYVWRDSKPGNGQSRIVVFWSEGSDDRREEYRAGVRDLPEAFKRTGPEPKQELTAVTDAVILPFGTGKSRRNTRQ